MSKSKLFAQTEGKTNFAVAVVIMPIRKGLEEIPGGLIRTKDKREN